MPFTPQWSIQNLPQGSLSGRRTATMQVRTIWDQAHAAQVAGECDLISGSWGMPFLAAMMATNPQLIFGPYLKSIQNPGGTNDFDASGTRYPTQWYVKMMDGSKARQGGTYVNWLMETGFYPETRHTATLNGPLSGQSITATCWADFHIQDAVAKTASTNAAAAQGGSHPFRALWFDSADTFSADNVPGFWATGPTANPGRNPHTLLAYTKQDFRDMVAFIGDAAQNGTFLGTLNPERLWVVGNGLRTASFAAHWNMAMVEGWLYNNGGAKFTSSATWEALMQTVLDCQLIHGTVAETLDWGAPSGNATARTQQRRLTAASDLIVNRGLKTFEWVGVGKSERPDLETAHDPSLYAMDLGVPLSSPALITGHRVAVGAGNGQASATGLYARLYDGGAALANLAATTIFYKADRTYTQVPSLEAPGTPSYTVGQQITIPALSGVFVTHAGGSGGATPTNTYLPALLGTPREGQRIRIEKGAYTGSPSPIITDQVQLSANGTTGWADITGETGPTYVIPFGSGGTPTTYASDDFSDTEVDTWASADTGGAWAVEQGATADFDKTSGKGTLSHTAANTGKIASLNLGQADADAVATFSFAAVPAGGNMQASLILRFQDTNNYLRINIVLFASGGHAFANPDKVVSSTATSLGTSKDLGSYSAGAGIKLRLRLQGTNLKGKAWVAAGAEPGSWDWDVTDSSITAAGKVAIRSYRGTGNTNTAPQTSVDDLVVSSLVGTITGIVTEYLRTHETATNSAGNVQVNSAALGPIVAGAPTDPIWTTLPTATGTPAEGATLTANPGTITGSPTPTVTYQWETSSTAAPGSASNISGETASTLVPASGTAGAYVRCNVQALNAGATVHQWTNWLGPLTVGSGVPAASVKPVISGTTTAGAPLTVTQGTWTGTPALTDQWQISRDSGATYSDITGQTALTYLLVSGDAGAYVRVAETGTNAAGAGVSFSDPVGVIVLPSNFPNLNISVSVE